MTPRQGATLTGCTRKCNHRSELGEGSRRQLEIYFGRRVAMVTRGISGLLWLWWFFGGGAAGLFFSMDRYAVTVPDNLPVGHDLVEFYLHQEPTAHNPDGGDVTVACAFRDVIKDGSDVSADINPFLINVVSQRIQLATTLEDALNDIAASVVFTFSVQCAGTHTTGDDVTASVSITVLSATEWRQRAICSGMQQASLSVAPSSPDAAGRMREACFMPSAAPLVVYENMVDIRLARLRPWVTPDCAVGRALIPSYSVQTLGKDDADRAPVQVDQDGQLTLRTALDRESNQSIHVQVTCHLGANPTADSFTHKVLIHVRDINDHGPEIGTRGGNPIKIITPHIPEQLIFYDRDTGGQGRYDVIVDAVAQGLVEVQSPIRVFDCNRGKCYYQSYVKLLEAVDEDLEFTVTFADLDVVGTSGTTQATFRLRATARTDRPFDPPPDPDGLLGGGARIPLDGFSIPDGLLAAGGLYPDGGAALETGRFPERPGPAGSDVDHGVVSDPDIAWNPELGGNPDMESHMAEGLVDIPLDEETGGLPASPPIMDGVPLGGTDFGQPDEGGEIPTYGVTELTARTSTIELNISRSAARFSRVANLGEWLSLKSWRMRKLVSPTGCLDVTPLEGVVYTTCNGSDLPAVGALVVQASSGTSSQHIINVIVTTLAETSDVSNETCEGSCSRAESAEDCASACGVGAPSGVCSWTSPVGYPGQFHSCSPQPGSCPDKHCDELERLVPDLCPQDCIRSKDVETLQSGSEEIGGIPASAAHTDFCYCPSATRCDCFSYQEHKVMQERLRQNEPLDPPPGERQPHDNHVATGNVSDPGNDAKPRSEEVIHPASTCDLRCTLLICLSLVGLGVVVLVAVVVWRTSRRKGRGVMKHVNSSVSLSAVPSDYVDDPYRQSVLLTSASTLTWSPKLVDARFRPDPEWEFPRGNLKLERSLGEGEFGRVVKAQALNLRGSRGYSTVAVKMLKDYASSSELRDLLSEYTLLKDVNHRNVIKLLGVCTLRGPFYIIVEYCEYGSLRSHLKKCRNQPITYLRADDTQTAPPSGRDNADGDDTAHAPSALTLNVRTRSTNTDDVVTGKDLLSFAWQISTGMQYLSTMKLVHRDLALRNILLAAGNVIKISDFGLTRDVYEGDAYFKKSKGRIPVKWMAPESLYQQVYTSKSDVWSYGVTLWEIITLGASPYPGIPPERLYHLLKDGYRMEKPPTCSPQLYHIMGQCWNETPAERPSFKQLAAKLEDMLQQDADYLDLHQVPDRSQYLDDDMTEQESVDGGSAPPTESSQDPDYGSTNVLPMDCNSYVITPSVHANGDIPFDTWGSRDDAPSDDGVGAETAFLSRGPISARLKERDLESRAVTMAADSDTEQPERRGLVSFVRV